MLLWTENRETENGLGFTLLQQDKLLLLLDAFFLRPDTHKPVTSQKASEMGKTNITTHHQDVYLCSKSCE
jgi:hypothetical protein